MTPAETYIQNEAKVIEKECLEKHISPKEWVQRYAEEYHRMYWNDSVQKYSVFNRKGVRG